MQSYGDDLPNIDAIKKALEEIINKSTIEFTSRVVDLQSSTRQMASSELAEAKKDLEDENELTKQMILSALEDHNEKVTKTFKRQGWAIRLVGLVAFLAGVMSTLTFLAAKGIS